MVIVPYEFLSRMGANQHQTRVLLDLVIERLPLVVQTPVQKIETRLRTNLKQEITILQGRVDGLEAHLIE